MKTKLTSQPKENSLTKKAGKALLRAAERARITARQHGTPLHVLETGRVVAVKP